MVGLHKVDGGLAPTSSAAHFTAYSMYCTHLGCPIHWLPQADMFLCPCHGSAFYASGSVAWAGDRALEHH